MLSLSLLCAFGATIATCRAAPAPQAPAAPDCSVYPTVSANGTVGPVDKECWNSLGMAQILVHWATNPPAECTHQFDSIWANCFLRLTDKIDEYVHCTTPSTAQGACPAPIPGQILQGTPDVYFGARAISGESYVLNSIWMICDQIANL